MIKITLDYIVREAITKGIDGTWDVEQAKEVHKDNGYFVSIGGLGGCYSIDEMLDNDTWEKISDKLANAFKVVKNLTDGEVFVGAWRDGNITCLDISLHIKDVRNAILQGLKNDQIAIWDCANDKAIFIGTRQKAGTQTQQMAQMRLQIEEIIDKL